MTNLIIFFIAETLKYLFKGDKNEVWNILENRYEDMILKHPLLIIPMLILMRISLSQGAKRCHDVGKSGWYLLIPFYVFYLIFAEGQRFDNKYGPKIK